MAENKKKWVDLEQEKIGAEIQYDEDYYTWLALTTNYVNYAPYMSEEEYLRFARDAVDAALQMNYNLMEQDYLQIRQQVERLYIGLLDKYHLPQEMREEAVYIMLVSFFSGRIDLFESIAKEEGVDDIPDMGEDDDDNPDMAKLFGSVRKNRQTEAWLKDLGVVWDYEQLHMVTWFASQITLGEGHYSRKEPNFSAKSTYNRLMEPSSLLWIAAVMEEDPEVVKAAHAEMQLAKTNQEKCKIIRKAIPFKRILDLSDKVLDELERILEEQGKW